MEGGRMGEEGARTDEWRKEQGKSFLTIEIRKDCGTVVCNGSEMGMVPGKRYYD